MEDKQEETVEPVLRSGRLRRICCTLSKVTLCGVVLMLLFLYWLLGTTQGTAFALRQASSWLEGIVGLEVPVVEGSILYGFKTSAPIRVEVPEVVSVTADSIDLQYNVFDVLTRGALVIDHLVIPNLKVRLLIDVLEESEETSPPEEDETPFRLNIPVHIVLNNLKSRDFAFLFQVVDVMADDLDLDLEVQGDYAGINRGVLDHLTVHLKDEIFSTPEAASAGKAELPASQQGGAEAQVSPAGTSLTASEHPATGSTSDVAGEAAAGKAELPASQPGGAEAQVSAAETSLTASEHTAAGSTPDAAGEAEAGEVLTFDGGDGLIEPLGDIPLPLIASIRGLQIKHGRYYMSMVDTGVFNTTITAMWDNTQLLVPEIRLEHLLGKGSLQGKIDFRDYMYLDFDLKAEGQRNAYTKLNFGGALYGLKAQGKLSGNLTDLNLDLSLLAPQLLSTTVRLNCLSSQLPAELRVQTARFAYPLLSEELAALEREEQQQETEDSEQGGSEEEQSEKEMAELGDYQPEWMKIDTSKPEWIIEQAVLSDFELKAGGNLAHGFKTSLSGTVNGYGAEQIRLALEGLITLTGTSIPKLEASGAYDKIPFSLGLEDFEAGYGEEVRLQGKLRGSSKDLSAAHALLGGPASLMTDFSLLVVPEQQGTVRLNLANTQAKFMLNQAEASLTAGKIAGNLLPELEVSALNFVHRSNHVDIDGQLSLNSNLRAVFALNDLSEMVPDSEGHFLGQLTVEGEASAPAMTLTAKSELFRLKDLLISKLMINSVLNVPEEKADVVVMSENLFLGQGIAPLKQCGFELNGTLLKHRLSMNCLGANSGYLSAEGSYDKVTEVWSGSLRDLLVATQYFKPIMLSAPMDIEVNLTTLSGRVSEFELTGDQLGQLKVAETHFGREQVTTRVVLQSLDLRTWNEYLPKNSRLRGFIDLNCEVQMQQGKPRLNAELVAENLAFFNPTFNFMSRSIKLKADLNEKQAEADLNLDVFRTYGNLMAHLKIEDPLGAQRLGGSLKLDQLNLAIFAGLGGGFNELTGTANIDGTLGGVLSNPLFNGTLDIKGTAEPTYDIGRIESFDLVLKALGQQGRLEGKVRLNEGDLNLQGDLNWASGANGNLRVQAKELPIFLLGYGVAYTNVDTAVQLGEVLSIKGQVEIPHAEIKVKNVEMGGISTSKDEVLVDERGTSRLIEEARKPQAPLNSELDLSVKLGDNIKVEAMGLRANVVGGIEIQKKVSEKEVRAEGVIELENGEADLYGHHFLVNRARTLFHGDIAKPQLDCEVVADPSTLDEDVVAGVHVKGSPDAPDIQLFSRPVMSQNEILSYMLYGHGLEKNSGNADSSSAELLMALGLGATTGVVNSLAGAFGMRNVTVGSSGTGDDSKVGIQGYLTKDIRIAYGYGLYNSVGEFSLRYEMMRRFYVEVVSSLNQAVNLIYSFSF